MIDSFRAAEILDVPILALGQIVFDGRLQVKMLNGNYVFEEQEVKALLNDTLYLTGLK